MDRIDRYKCEETFRRLDDYVDRELSPDELHLVQQHLEVCAYCMLEFEFEASLVREVRQKLRAIPTPAGLLDRVLGAVRDARAESENPPPPEGPGSR